MNIEIGDRVDFLDEAGGGRVTRFLDRRTAMVELDAGLEHPYPIEQLIKREESEAIPYGRDEAFQKRIREKEATRSPYSKRRNVPRDKLEVDLHIEELHDRPMQLSNSEILRKQVDHCRAQVQRARRESIPRVIIIHGVGEGVLKSAIRDMLDREHGELLYFDAPMREYGRGATEVRLG
jgi:hypothetical protein